jgi:hypothetical protein
MKYFYLLAAVIGAVVPWYFNLQAMSEEADGFTAIGFLMVGFQGSAMLGSLAADFWIGAVVSIVWMVVECQRLKMPRLWLYIVVTFMVAWACSLPLFLYFRERHLAAET